MISSLILLFYFTVWGFFISFSILIFSDSCSRICRKSWHTTWRTQCICPCNYVQLLLFDLGQARTSKIKLVEEVHHTSSVGKIRVFLIQNFRRSQLHTLTPFSFRFPSQVQFGILVIHFSNPVLFFDCAFPKALAVIGVIQNLFMFILFFDFYLKAYVRKREKML